MQFYRLEPCSTGAKDLLTISETVLQLINNVLVYIFTINAMQV